MNGRLKLFVGCMFAGKTAALIQCLRESQAHGLRVAAFKHRLDARYHAIELATHDGARFPAIAVARAADLEQAAAGLDVVGLDEAQFFGDELVDVVQRLLERGTDVIAAGIDFTIRGRPFDPFPALKALAGEIIELHAPCDLCGRPARFSQRVTPIREGNMVGGRNDYSPRCEACFEPWLGEIPAQAS